MDIVLREIDRLDHLITDFLHYARPQAPRLRPVPVQEAVDEVLEVFRAECPAGIEVATRLEAGLLVHADPSQLRQALWNLVRNAVEAMPGGGTLELRAAAPAASQEREAEGRNEAEEGRKAPWVEICVSDTGQGIPPEALDRIFEPFFTTKAEGSGLGLATVHRIVEGHRGSIRLEARPGGGTRVCLRLPRAEAAP
jgi:two-component system sensor histidine kinase PilS (NtrC family)